MKQEKHMQYVPTYRVPRATAASSPCGVVFEVCVWLNILMREKSLWAVSELQTQKGWGGRSGEKRQDLRHHDFELK